MAAKPNEEKQIDEREHNIPCDAGDGDFRMHRAMIAESAGSIKHADAAVSFWAKSLSLKVFT
jgi:hypothetical protein